jgi:hypothetical protein
MEKKGIETEKGTYNRKVQEDNTIIELIDKQISLLEKQKEVLNYGQEQINGDRKQAFGNRKLDTANESILFGHDRENQKHRSRTDKPNELHKKQNEGGRRIQGELSRREDLLGKKEPRNDREVEQDYNGIASRDGRLKEDEWCTDRADIKDFSGRIKEERGIEKRNLETNNGVGLSGEENRTVNVEGESEILCSNHIDNSRSYSGDANRAVEGSITVDSIVQALSKSIEKAEKNEQLEIAKSNKAQSIEILKEQVKKDKVREYEIKNSKRNLER